MDTKGNSSKGRERAKGRRKGKREKTVKDGYERKEMGSHFQPSRR